ncbi:hypothetical protein ElyMa_000242200 [Elysia marginata]|uniref:Uncharacterized protein n=1 Tax=Elysia marginata TaxID=1093978 RepID=A0AAV4F2F5_9GAST|nr:hypothetical protein ElyMa_000242200 [Elysia marginata]
MLKTVLDSTKTLGQEVIATNSQNSHVDIRKNYFSLRIVETWISLPKSLSLPQALTRSKTKSTGYCADTNSAWISLSSSSQLFDSHKWVDIGIKTIDGHLAH